MSWRCALTFPAALRDTSLSTSCQAAPFKNQQSKSMTLPIKLGGSGCKGKVDELLMQFEESAAFKGVDCGQLLARTQTEHYVSQRDVGVKSCRDFSPSTLSSYLAPTNLVSSLVFL